MKRVELEVRRKRKMIWNVLSLGCWLRRKSAAYEYDRVLLLEEILPKPFAPRRQAAPGGRVVNILEAVRNVKAQGSL